MRLIRHESGAPVSQRVFVVDTLREGKIAAIIGCRGEHEALEAAACKMATAARLKGGRISESHWCCSWDEAREAAGLRE